MCCSADIIVAYPAIGIPPSAMPPWREIRAFRRVRLPASLVYLCATAPAICRSSSRAESALGAVTPLVLLAELGRDVSGDEHAGQLTGAVYCNSFQ